MDFFNTHVSKKSLELVNEVLLSSYLSEGKIVKEFENSLASNLGLVNPIALNSGTSALHLALVIAGIKEGDEVIIPAQTFVATGLVVLMQRAIPVFADIDYLTGNISTKSIREKITNRTKAIIPVHWGGYPCDMNEIQIIAKEFNLVVIEDAAHALGATYNNHPIGSISEFTAFSFQAIKHLTTGDGGALCCLDQEKYQEAMTRRWFGIDRANSNPSVLGERIYDISKLGYKYHMNDFSAALGLGNLDDLESRLFRRQFISEEYNQQLNHVSGIKCLSRTPDRKSACWLYTILVEKREDFIRKLASEGIPASVVHLRIDHNSIFGGLRKDLPGQSMFNSHQVSIPTHENLSDDDICLIIDTIKKGW